MSSSAPTPQQIVQQNINNMMDWLNHAHDYLQDVMNECYLKINEDPTVDQGQQWANSLINDLLWGMGGIGFPGSAFVSAFLANLYWSYVTSPPHNLDGQMGTMWARFSQSFLDANDTLAQIYGNVDANWNTVYTNPVTNQQTKVSDLVNVSMPGKDSVLFQQLTDSAVASFRLSLAKQLLPMKWVNAALNPSPFLMDMNMNDYHTWWAPDFMKVNHAYFLVNPHYVDEGNCCAPHRGVDVSQHWLATNPGIYRFNEAPNDLCTWLFKDDGLGNTTNSEALATRADVFNNWGLRSQAVMNPGHSRNLAVAAVDAEAPKARPRPYPSQTKTIQDLLKTSTRLSMEERLIEKARSDAAFRTALVQFPRATVEQFLGFNVPDSVRFHVVQEQPGQYLLVIPWVGSPQHGTAEPDEHTASPLNTIEDLVNSPNRIGLEQQLIAKACSDPSFMGNLVLNPRQAIESYFGLTIPEGFDVGVLQERARKYFFVIPSALG